MRRALLPAALALALPLEAQSPRNASSYPFGVGETFEYVGKLGILTLGTGVMSVAGIDTVRGVESFRFRFHLQANTIVFKLDDVMQSWTGTGDMVSRRFHQDFSEGDEVRRRYYEIYPDSLYIERQEADTGETVADPLDDAAFFYFIRTVPLEVGRTYNFDRYFRKKKNPVTIIVEKRESCDLPDDRKTTCLVLHPIIESDRKGMFSRRADARIWLTDDVRRIPVQIRSRLSFGTVTLKLRSIRLAGG